MSLKVTVIDAYDSFVHIIVGYINKLGCETRVFRKDHIDLLNELTPDKCDLIILGPGPGHPSESGYFSILEYVEDKIPVLGICLGHQAIGMYFEAQIGYAERLMHGKISLINHDGNGCFSSFKGNSFKAMRYHSIIIEKKNFPKDLIITATSDIDNYIMGIRHKFLPIEGIQFHPESVGTENGLNIIQNFIKQYCLVEENKNEYV
ncbi:aminodeoxychorismate/anthranilate synthase component II [Acinetobacter baumannii]|uniref:anthranilate synthase component II n=1 Tax=Acinetobacter baumannii TaxID=470 RepID=UPI001C0C14FE|nr:aminodeoxychorismate/anthranilate synthase component II [Acinetobacter baumannii]MBU3082495.1 aminodeoxychorismate/anthranilate synthase component II [Acinetobacter baumannii]MDC4652072.1 aminodeoxychorismate/anthranilate synthase component II [Acinetobacter baumannii]MDC5116121.1 aminodeoxychorismate/anthranilate synthase component II [Acinetobacter baumannii]MDC5449588.1 aminodeoxychorismate/anthranilate synthase component II [Acinetobacter baumannii]